MDTVEVSVEVPVVVPVVHATREGLAAPGGSDQGDVHTIDYLTRRPHPRGHVAWPT